jgi:DNA polymerase IV
VTLKVKYADFHQITRSTTNDAPNASQSELEQFSFALRETIFPTQKGIRSTGRVSSVLTHL